MVLRQHQARAVEKVIGRVHDPNQAARACLAHTGQWQDPYYDNDCLSTVAWWWGGGKADGANGG